MSEETLARTFERVLASPHVSGRFTAVWHAGEPLVLPVDYYQRAFEIIDRTNRDGVAVHHSFQTNGLLLDEAWIGLFKARRVRLGISLDGPPHLHDRNRKTRAGAGTFERVMRAVRLLQEHEFPFHVITVLTADALRHPDQLFDFYVENGIQHVGFNIEEIEGVNETSSLDRPDIVSAYKAFLRRFLMRTNTSGRPLNVREFASALGAILDPAVSRRGNPQADPFRIVSVDVDGNMSTFSPELLGIRSGRYGNFAFGNVHRHDLLEITRAWNFRAVDAAIRTGIEKCRAECEYFSVCGGGAPANKFFETGRFDSTETLYCRLTRQAIMEVMLEDLERQLELSKERVMQEDALIRLEPSPASGALSARE